MAMQTLPPVFVTTMVLAAIMGFAIQRGATCTVAAVEQVIVERRTQRLQSLLLAAATVLAGLLLAHALGLGMDMPPGYAPGFATLAGGVLLGLGAFVNRACVFGSIAKLGAGQWSYLLTPAGYFLGCLALDNGTQAVPKPSLLPFASSMATSLLVAMPLLAVLFCIGLRWSRRSQGVPGGLRDHLHQLATRRLWEPGAATVVIGLAFLLMWLQAGAWSYTDLLAELARGMPMDVIARSLLFAALLLGAVLGGCSAGRRHAAPFRPGAWLRCLGGGALMGIGSTLIPGSNDGLLLVGMPLLWPYAWLAVAAMALTIGIAILLGQRLQRAGARPPVRAAGSG